MSKKPTYYTGKKPLKVPAATIESVLNLLQEQGVSSEVSKRLRDAVDPFSKVDGGSLGDLHTLQEGLPETDLVAVSPKAINAIKKALFSVNAHDHSELAAMVVSVRTCNCPGPDPCKCPIVG